DRGVEDVVHQLPGAALEERVVTPDALDGRVDARRVRPVDRHDEVAPHEGPEIEGLDVVEILRLGHEAHAADDGQRVRGKLLDLHAAFGGGRVLDAQRVELEDAAEQGPLFGAVGVDVHPE